MSNSITTVSDVGLDKSYSSVVAMGVYAGDTLEWVQQSVESILNQTYQSFVFVIVIDGELAQDMSEYLKSIAQDIDKIVLMEGSVNVGLSQCMNEAVDWSIKKLPNLQYFFRMDADDVALPERFAKQIAFFTDNPDVSVLGTSLVEINENGKQVGKRKLPTGHDEIARVLPKRCAINHPTVALRVQVFKDGFRYRSDLKNTQDYFLWAILCSRGYKFANLPEALLKFRRVNDFYKRRGLSKSINEFKARFYTMEKLGKYTIGNVIYALGVLILRLMPSKVVKLAYRIDRYLLNK